jgi:hypothetical protein
MSETAVERVDPKPMVASPETMGKVTNQDPDRVYMLANPNEDSFGATACESNGWSYLIAGSCKEKVIGARKAIDGTNRMMVQGQYVMWKPRSEHEAYLREKHTRQLRLSQVARKGETNNPETVEHVRGNDRSQRQGH